MKLNNLLISILLTTVSSYCVAAETLKQVSIGSTPLYHYLDKRLQDLSGSAYVNGTIYLASDGGKNSNFPEIRVSNYEALNEPAHVLQRQLVQRDIEGATQINNTVFITSSMSQANEDTDDYRVVSAMNLGVEGKLLSEKYIYGRQSILDSMETEFGDHAWLRRVKVSFGKSGGINVEGLSASHNGDKGLVFGFRSPLYATNFGSPELDPSLSLKQGKAILLEVDSSLTKNSTQGEISLIDLGGQGIRGMEYIPAIKSYIIISGAVEKLNEYHLWQYTPATKKVVKISKEGSDFYHLCRPESVLNIPETSTLVILSEESGKACANVEFNFVAYEY